MIHVPRELAEKADEISHGLSGQTRTSIGRRSSIVTDTNAGSHPRGRRNSIVTGGGLFLVGEVPLYPLEKLDAVLLSSSFQ